MKTMKKNRWQVIAIALVVTLALFGFGYAGLSGPHKDKVTLQGTINEFSQLVGVAGETFELADTVESVEVKSLIGNRVEIKGTVMEEEGRKIVEVHEYKILEE
jgi:hypothetical protein